MQKQAINAITTIFFTNLPSNSRAKPHWNRLRLSPLFHGLLHGNERITRILC
jgi:hypothetical protein